MDETGASPDTAINAHSSGMGRPAAPIFLRRISIVGASGSGKTFLARKLARKLGITLYELDELRNGTDGRRLNDAEFAMVVADIVARDEWVIDGHYRAVRELVWQRAGQIVWFDYPILFIARRLIGRYLRKLLGSNTSSTEIPGMPKGERASWSRRAQRIVRILQEQRAYSSLLRGNSYRGARILRLDHPALTEAFIAAIREGPDDGPLPDLEPPPPKTRIIELFGLPGCGKSTLAVQLASRLQYLTRDDVSARWARQSTLVKAGYIVRSLLDWRTVLAAMALAIKARLTAPESLFRLIRLVAKRHWLRRQGATVLLDQGFLQDIWSILFEARSRDIDRQAISRLIAALYRGTEPSFFYLDLGPETAANRIAERTEGASRLDQLPEQQVRDRLVQVNWIPELIVSAVRATGIVPNVLDARNPREQVLEAALAVLAAEGLTPPG